MHLIEHNFLNEERFAKSFARGKHRIKNWGKTRITNELKMRNISTFNINSGLKEIDLEDYINQFETTSERFWSNLFENNIQKKRKKFVDYFLRKGYESSLIYDQLNILEKKEL